MGRIRRGLGGHRAGASIGNQIGVEGQQLLDEAVHVMAVGEGVMDVQGGMRLSVTDKQPKVH